MSLYAIFCFLAGAAILITYFNTKFSHIQSTIAITAGSLALSLLIVLAGLIGWFDLKSLAANIVNQIHFDTFLLKGVLGFLLFAGALGVKLPNLKDQKWEIAILAIFGTLISTFIVATGAWFFFKLIGISIDYIYCLLFGALISPTDPIAVLAIVKKMHAPKRISTQIEGESLFNDGIGLVIFITIFTIAFGNETPTVLSVTTLFLHEAIGGIAYGFALGLLFHYLICHTDDHSMELLLTIGIPTAGFVFADLIGVSGPLAMVVAGILIGNWTRYVGFSKESQSHLDKFWELVDEFLNGVLFLLIGFIMLTINFHLVYWLIIAMAIPLVLLARFISVKLCYLSFIPFRQYNPHSINILTWGGLRGGLAIAMAVAIPSGYMLDAKNSIDVREIILVMTYAIVVFSILVQGSSITKLINKAKAAEQEKSQ